MFLCLENLKLTSEPLDDIHIIPTPKFFKIKNQSLKIIERTVIATDLTEDFKFIIEQFQVKLRTFGLKKELSVKIIDNPSNFPRYDGIKKKCQLELNVEKFTDILYEKQGYSILVDKSNLIIEAITPQGIFYGIQTLIQLLNSNKEKLIFSAVTIIDESADIKIKDEIERIAVSAR